MTRKNPDRSRRGNHRDLGGIGRQEVIACQVRRGVSPSLCKNVLVCVCVRACHEYIDVFNIRAGLSGGGRGLHQNPYPPDFIA